MASLPDDDIAVIRNQEWGDAAAAIIEHVIDSEPHGCTMHVVVCPEGQRLAEAERAAWDAYRAARDGGATWP